MPVKAGSGKKHVGGMFDVSGDLGKRDNDSFRKAFPHPIKNAGGELSGSQAFGSNFGGEPGTRGEKNSKGGIKA